MKFLVPIAFLILSGCDPTAIRNIDRPNGTLVQNPACLFVCIPSVDNIGETNARGVDNFTGQTSTRTNTNTGGTR